MQAVGEVRQASGAYAEPELLALASGL
jgi:hypothetical protein